ncbi:P-loop containing nucleoside triphosphate hydrolase protein [Hymenopellis radicata]|nr:P-loop containing nucleoside triphosphate hydrolase protein [Hymenopellis radicata]
MLFRKLSLPQLFIRRKCPLLLQRYSSAQQTRSFTPSLEQSAVVEQLQTSNVIVSARPGAGKTATAEAVLQANPDIPVAVITYSKRLQMDTQKRLAEYPLADIYTFHGLASRFFGTLVYNDAVFRSLRDAKTLPVWPNMPQYSLVILDEIQDLTDDLYWLTCTFISTLTRARGHAPRLLVLGDPKQAIYNFRGADERYLELSASNFAALSPYEWHNRHLSTSFRLSRSTARFQYIEGSHDGAKPLYIHANLRQVHKVIRLLIPLIRKYGHENTAILAPTVRGSAYVKLLVNELLDKHQIPSAPATADYGLDEDVFKGSERDLVIVLGVDSSYFHFMGRDLHDDHCPNATFVALTRAKKQLVVLQSHEYPPMPFVDWEAVIKDADFVNLLHSHPKPQYEPGRPLQLGLLLPLKVAATDAPGICPDKVCTDPRKNLWEPVSDLNGLAVTADFELWLTGRVTAYNQAKSKNILTPEIVQDETQRAIWFSKEATYYESVSSGYKSRWAQMSGHSFDWLAPYLRPATLRLAEQFSEFDLSQLKRNLQVEVPMRRDVVIGDQKTRLTGRVDIIHEKGKDDATIWEIKFVSELTYGHVIQTTEDIVFPRLVLYNVRNNEKWEIVTTREGAWKAIVEVLTAKYTSAGKSSTEAFLARCATVREEAEALVAQL